MRPGLRAARAGHPLTQNAQIIAHRSEFRLGPLQELGELFTFLLQTSAGCQLRFGAEVCAVQSTFLFLPTLLRKAPQCQFLLCLLEQRLGLLTLAHGGPHHLLRLDDAKFGGLELLLHLGQCLGPPIGPRSPRPFFQLGAAGLPLGLRKAQGLDQQSDTVLCPLQSHAPRTGLRQRRWPFRVADVCVEMHMRDVLAALGLVYMRVVRRTAPDVGLPQGFAAGVFDVAHRSVMCWSPTDW